MPTSFFSHEYAHQTVLCASTKCTISQAFQVMLSSTRFIAPTDEDRPVTTGIIVQVNVLLKKNNPIAVTVMPTLYTVVNRTLPGHILYPGSVTRKLIERSGTIIVDTQGVGTGKVQGSFNVLNYTNPLNRFLPSKYTPSGAINDIAAAVVWGGVDKLLKARIEAS